MGESLLHQVHQSGATRKKLCVLAKFLEQSKVPQRLYHGTPATEGGKGQEAIRTIKPSKEGSLGSGVYMTPKADFAGSYAESIGGNVLPVHAQMVNPLIIEGKSIPPLGINQTSPGPGSKGSWHILTRIHGCTWPSNKTITGPNAGTVAMQLSRYASLQPVDGGLGVV